MKQVSVLLIGLTAFAGTSTWAQSNGTGNIRFEERTHHFGDIPEGDKVTHVFRFTNEGDAPLRVLDVKPACGCTTPDWTRDPVPPGEQGAVTAEFNSAARPGTFRKAILIETDGEPSSATLYIEGDVVPPTVDVTQATRMGSFAFETDVYDFGTVPQANFLTHTFRFVNDGDRPVRIQGVQTVGPELSVTYPSKPVFSGDVVDLVVTVDARNLETGVPFDYGFALITNDDLQPQKILRVKGQLQAVSGDGKP